jgi:hypothetical protein
MSEEKPSQSLNISGGQLSNIQIGGVAGSSQTVNQSQKFNQETSGDLLTQAKVLELIDQLEILFLNAGLSAEKTDKAIKHLATAKEEAKTEKPDKDFAAKNLLRATTVLKEAGETVDASTGLWKKVQPIIEMISPWLGVAVNFFI